VLVVVEDVDVELEVDVFEVVLDDVEVVDELVDEEVVVDEEVEVDVLVVLVVVKVPL